MTVAPVNDNDERLTQNTSYEVHVKAKTPERDSAWSARDDGQDERRQPGRDFRRQARR